MKIETSAFRVLLSTDSVFLPSNFFSLFTEPELEFVPCQTFCPPALSAPTHCIHSDSLAYMHNDKLGKQNLVFHRARCRVTRDRSKLPDQTTQTAIVYLFLRLCLARYSLCLM